MSKSDVRTITPIEKTIRRMRESIHTTEDISKATGIPRRTIAAYLEVVGDPINTVDSIYANHNFDGDIVAILLKNGITDTKALKDLSADDIKRIGITVDSWIRKVEKIKLVLGAKEPNRTPEETLSRDRDMYDLRMSGTSVRDIAAQYGLSELWVVTRIKRIKNIDAWEKAKREGVLLLDSKIDDYRYLFGATIANSLSRLGIVTIEDLINADEKVLDEGPSPCVVLYNFRRHFFEVSISRKAIMDGLLDDPDLPIEDFHGLGNAARYSRSIVDLKSVLGIDKIGDIESRSDEFAKMREDLGRSGYSHDKADLDSCLYLWNEIHRLIKRLREEYVNRDGLLRIMSSEAEARSLALECASTNSRSTKMKS